jgi:transcriptional regulator with XRE-family HTH domain
MSGEIARAAPGGSDTETRPAEPGPRDRLAELTVLARVSSSQPLNPIPGDVPPEIQDFAKTLRVLFSALGMSLNRLAALLHSDPGTVSRYLSGKRVPPPDFIEGLCKAVYDAKGSLITPQVQELVHEQFLVALRAHNPARYEVQRLTDLLQAAAQEKRQYEITVGVLEEAIASRNDKLYELELEGRQLRSAWARAEGLLEEERKHRERLQEEMDSLYTEVSHFREQLLSAQRRAAAAEERCRELESQLDSAGALLPDEDHAGTASARGPARHPGTPAVPAARAPRPGGGGPTVLRILLGSHLRRLREARGITTSEAAHELRVSMSKISRIEHGRSAIREIDVLDLLTLYGVHTREREQLLTLAEQSNRPGWWHKYNDILPEWFQLYVGMEEAAQSIRVYEAQFIPGLLQTEDYAAAVISLDDNPIGPSERLVMLRKERQRRFRKGNQRLWVIIEETALRRPVGGPGVQLEQLRYLQEACASHVLTLQVIPYGAGGHATPGGFSVLRFAERDLPDIVYVENLTGALYLDQRTDVDRYLAVLNRLSGLATSPDQTQQLLSHIIADL